MYNLFSENVLSNPAQFFFYMWATQNKGRVVQNISTNTTKPTFIINSPSLHTHCNLIGKEHGNAVIHSLDDYSHMLISKPMKIEWFEKLNERSFVKRTYSLYSRRSWILLKFSSLIEYRSWAVEFCCLVKCSACC